jgi:hypothetical protein
MDCTILAKYLEKNECITAVIPEEIQKHLVECNDCQNYSRFIAALNLQRGSLEKAPEDILPNIEKKIFESMQHSKKGERFHIFNSLLKPSLAGFFVVLVIAASFQYLNHKNIGYVENLSERFKLAQFENIKSGDMLYAGNNTTAAVSLKGKNKLQIHQNTIVKVKSSRQLSLSRGEISLLSGDNELQVETPVVVLLARNTNATIRTVTGRVKDSLQTETTCLVFSGKVTIKHSSKEIIIGHGQKVVLTEKGGISDHQQLTAAEAASAKSTLVQQKILTAVESLCDCIFASDIAPGKKADHLELLGKEVDENKFKVRVFWKEKELKDLVTVPLRRNTETCSIKIRRIRA